MDNEQNKPSPIEELIKEIQRLIDITSRENETQKQRLNFLFRQLEKVRHIQVYQNNPQLLNAFLLIQGFYYKTDFDLDKMTERISQEIELVRQKIEPEDKTIEQFSYEQVGGELERRKKLEAEIKKKYNIQ